MKWTEAYEHVLANLEEFEACQDAGLIPDHFNKAISEKTERDQQRIKVWQALNAAVRQGVVTKKPCVICGALKVVGHHPDYSKPLDVIWLCRDHHRAEHKRLKSEATTR
jgi:hypothetical protein